LISTEQQVKQICKESGFEDVSNFIKRFNGYHGMTPTAMRKKRTDSAQTEAQK